MELVLHKREHIAAWRESGLSQRAYCREHRLNAKIWQMIAYRSTNQGRNILTDSGKVKAGCFI